MSTCPSYLHCSLPELVLRQAVHQTPYSEMLLDLRSRKSSDCYRLSECQKRAIDCALSRLELMPGGIDFTCYFLPSEHVPLAKLSMAFRKDECVNAVTISPMRMKHFFSNTSRSAVAVVQDIQLKESEMQHVHAFIEKLVACIMRENEASKIC